MEGMACKVPQIVPDWSALGEWCRGSAELVPCTSIGVHPANINTIGGIVDKSMFNSALENTFNNRPLLDEMANAGYSLVTKPEYTWKSIGSRFSDVFDSILNGRSIENAVN